MRVTLIALLLCPLAFAQEAEGEKKEAPKVATTEGGQFTHTAWNLTFKARGLEEGIPGQNPSILFTGRAAGSVQVEIRVLEGAKKMKSAEWMKTVLDAWKKAEKKMDDVTKSTEGEPAWVMFTETKLDVFTEEHGYAFYARGMQCFMVHCYVAEKTDKSAENIKKYLGNLKLGEDPGAAMLVMVFAARSGRPMDDPRIVFAAAMEYATGQRSQGRTNTAVAAKLFKSLRKHLEGETFDASQKWFILELGGMSHLMEPVRDLKTAIEWHGHAEKAAKNLPEDQGRVERQGQSAYNLACAYSLNGDVEKAFEALHRAFSKKMPVDAAHLTNDTDLNNMKKNKELWDKFWKERVEGR